MNDLIHFENRDCMDGMKQYPDKFFDLAIVDPPYGAGFTEGGGCQGWFSKYHQTDSQSVQVEREREREREREQQYNRFGSKDSRFERYKREDGESSKKIIAWDVAPDQTYFNELFRVSRNQIIWGGNYFSLPPTRCFLIWRKLTISESFTMAMCEYAWTSFNSNAKWVEIAPQGDANRFHPTQKPIKLYQWILDKYATQGMKILDTHVGSGSSLIACARMGYECWGFEIDEEYYRKASERIERELAQGTLF